MSVPNYRAAAEQIAYDLNGTCDSLQAALERREWDGYDNVSEFCDTLDSIVFECTCCGWWLEQSEMSEDPDHDWECCQCAEE